MLTKEMELDSQKERLTETNSSTIRSCWQGITLLGIAVASLV